jgi:hypothetical protein
MYVVYIFSYFLFAYDINSTLYQNAVFWLVDERGIFLPILRFFIFSIIAGIFA